MKDLSAQRSGDIVLLRWTTPSRTTDDMDIHPPMTAEICRGAAATPPATEARLTACTPVLRLTVAPGQSEAADALPPSLQTGPAGVIVYRIAILNSAGRSAGNAAAAYAAAGAAPAEVSHLQARASEQGAILEWQSGTARETGPPDVIDLTRLDLTAPTPVARRAKPVASQRPGKNKPPAPRHTEQEPPNEVHLRVADSVPGAGASTAGTVDTTAAMGSSYSYVARRVRSVTVGGRALTVESRPSAPVTLAMVDTFPPDAPVGLETISGGTAPDEANGGTQTQTYIDLSWEPNTEPDLVGYRVYRQLARPDGSPQGPLARLTALPIEVPAYRDVAVRPGQGYIYTVTAVDAAGNESAPSAKAREVPSREAVGPPH